MKKGVRLPVGVTGNSNLSVGDFMDLEFEKFLAKNALRNKVLPRLQKKAGRL